MTIDEFVVTGLRQVRDRERQGFETLLSRANERGIDVSQLPEALKAPLLWAFDLTVLTRGVALWLFLREEAPCPDCARAAFLFYLVLDERTQQFAYRCMGCAR